MATDGWYGDDEAAAAGHPGCPSTVPTGDLKNRAADQDICTGLPKANHG
jgi:hypothetical protein